MNRRHWLRMTLAAAALGGARAIGAQSPIDGATAIPPLRTPIDIPDVVLFDGTRLPGTYWRGKVLVVELWASWCPFCAKQNPLLDRLHRDHRMRGLEVLALSIDRRSDDAVKYLREHAYTFHAAMFDERWRAAIGKPKQIPTVWVIARDGRLRYVETREMFPEDVAELARFLRD